MTSRAKEKLPEIVTVEGLDAVVIGLSDLAQSLGHPGENEHPEVRRVVERILETTGRASGAVAGFNLHRWEEGCELAKMGVRWFTIHASTMLARGTRELFGLLGHSDSGR